MESHQKSLPLVQNKSYQPETQLSNRQIFVSFSGANLNPKQEHHLLGDDNQNNANNLKFKQYNGNKFYKPSTPEINKELSASEQSRIKALKVYQHNGHFESKLPDRLTFGPDDFPKDINLNKPPKELNPEQILPVTHKKKEKSKSIVKLNHFEENKKSKIYEIMRKELGLNDEKLESLRPDTINHEL